MKLFALSLALMTSVAFADHTPEHKKAAAPAHDKEHAHVTTGAKDHDHDDAHHKPHDHKAHHPSHDADAAATKTKK